MGTEITQHSSIEDIFAQVANEGSTLKGGEGGKAFMKFNGNDGKFSYGGDENPLQDGDQFVMNPLSYRRGYVTWVASRVVNETMRGITEGKMPTLAELPDNGPYAEGDGPVEQYTIELATTFEPHIEMIFQANNGSKRRAFAALMKDFNATYKNHPGKFPVVEISSTEFEATINNRKITKYAPKFKIITWITTEQMEEMKSEAQEGSPEDYVEAPAQLETKPAQAAAKSAPKPAATPAKAAAVPATAAPARARGRF